MSLNWLKAQNLQSQIPDATDAMELTYLFSLFLVEHKARPRLLHCVLSFVALSAVIQSFHPILVLSHSAVLVHVSTGLSLFLFPPGAQVSAVLVLTYFFSS